MMQLDFSRDLHLALPVDQHDTGAHQRQRAGEVPGDHSSRMSQPNATPNSGVRKPNDAMSEAG
jgi:hypothetical protein